MIPVGTTPPPVPNATLRLLTPSSAKPEIFLISTPVDKNAATAEGSTIWRFNMKPWSEQIDELILAGQYSDALVLLESIDESSLPDKAQRRTRVRALNAVSQFRVGKFDEAIDTFIDLDFNPAKVVALYPEAVSGRLAVPSERWIPLYGGPIPTIVESDTRSTLSRESDKDKDKGSVGSASAATDLLDTVAASASLKNRFQKSALGMLRPSGPKDDDTASITSRKRFVHGECDMYDRCRRN